VIESARGVRTSGAGRFRTCDPCRIKGAGAEKSGERSVATPDQVLAQASAMPERWRALVLLAASTSLTWGELMALIWANLDLDQDERSGTELARRSGDGSRAGDSLLGC